MFGNRRKLIKEKLRREFGNLKVDSFDFEQIENYFQKKDHTTAFQTLSDKTCNDLDFQELFMFIDRTNSKVGQQYLYHKLRTIPLHNSKNAIHEKLIGEFTNNPDFRVSVQSQLSKLNEREVYYIASLFQDEILKPPKWYFIVPFLSFTSVLSFIMVFFNPVFFIALLGLSLINIVIHFSNKKNLFNYFSSIPQLSKLNNVAQELFKNDSLKEINADLMKSAGVLNKVNSRMSVFNLEAGIQSDQQILFWALLEIVKIVFLIEPLFLFGTLKRIDTKRTEIEDVFLFVGEIDAIVSISSLRKGLTNFCTPKISDGQKRLFAQEVYHPLIENCVKNNLKVNDKSILLTGSNMSGKTSFIRTIAINVITGLTINTCFAQQFSMPRVRVFSAIRISDDLMNDKSYYFEEVITIKDMIDKSKSENLNLFLLDEIFKGTNTVERISAGKAVLSSLNKENNIVFVSTHDIELADLLKEEYDLYHFSEIVDHKTVDFDYKIKEGKLKNRNAIRILQINDYPESIIKEAIEISEELDKFTVANTCFSEIRG
ncbi:MAG: DNA mismatch repair protein MutS [Paludibacter sp.]|nr:DNA mismatch repair protein MutS [Paludibacter sp.]